MRVPQLTTSAKTGMSFGRVVLVEDSDEVRHSLTLLLRTRGFSVDAYRSGIELLSAKFPPMADGFLIDFKMPSVNGLELLQKLRARGVVAPAIMLTGYLTTYLKTLALEAGFEDVIEKPPEYEFLIERITTMVHNLPD